MKNLVAILVVIAAAAAVLACPSSESNGEDGKRLIETSETEPAKWLTQEEIESLIRNKIDFMDITDHPHPPAQQIQSTFVFPDVPKYQSTVRPIFPSISTSRMETFITQFVTYNNRMYNQVSGQQSSDWLLAQARAVLAASGYRGQASVEPFTHTWLQNSVIARIEGSDPTLKSELIVLGAHQDSLNLANQNTGRAPGADDDGSGCVVLLETFRAILTSGVIPKRSIEFQWYAAEEVGLRGSQAIANDYKARGVNIISMINFDVVGYYTGRNEIGIITDNTTAAISAFLRKIVEEYCTFVWKNLTCGYACSDHASFYRAGYPTGMPVEVVFFPQMHTTSDTIDKVNFNQVLEFTKLAVGFVVEVAEPSNV